ncbi:hypothetical protein M758_11G084600 [Ceratodon purpureus]|nr:hypothetical protein M758_11G084600 [Ceratodon purpureus]
MGAILFAPIPTWRESCKMMWEGQMKTPRAYVEGERAYVKGERLRVVAMEVNLHSIIALLQVWVLQSGQQMCHETREMVINFEKVTIAKLEDLGGSAPGGRNQDRNSRERPPRGAERGLGYHVHGDRL